MSEQTAEATTEQAVEHAHDDHHINYVRIWGILVALLIVSVIGPFIGDATGWQWLTLITAFGIALWKAALVVKNFMHLTAERAYVTYFIVTTLVFMFLFFAGTAPDVMKAEGERWRKPLWQEQAAVAAAGHGASHGEDAAH